MTLLEASNILSKALLNSRLLVKIRCYQKINNI